MKKRGLLLLLVSAVLTGCQPADISSIIEDVLDKEETVEADDAAEDATDAGTSDENGAGQSNSAASDEDYGVYEDLISKIKEGLEKGDLKLSELDLSEKTVLPYVPETSEDYKDNEDNDVYGYLTKDLDGDGTKELILGANSYIAGTKVPLGSYDSVIYDIFTLKDGNLVHVLKANKDERYFFAADGEIFKEQGGENVTFPICVVGTFYKFAGDKLDIVDGIRCEFDKETEEDIFYYSTQDPYKDSSNAVSFEKIDEIIDKRCNEFVEFTKFVDPAEPAKKATVYTRAMSDGFRYSELNCWVDRYKAYIKFYDDNTGELDLKYNGDGGYYKFTYDDNKIHVTGWINNPDAGGGDKIDGIEYEYKIEGNTLKFKDEEGEWSDFVKEEN